jgi:RNA recognition motif-containing protein
MSTFQSTSLFVGDLSIYCTEGDLQKLFSPFGSIEAIRVKKGGADKLNLAYGFVKFHRREHAEKAMNMMNGHVLLGRALK